MKKYYILLSALLTLICCTNTEQSEQPAISVENQRVFKAVVEDGGSTRANYLSDNGNFYWVEGDQISVLTDYDEILPPFDLISGAGSSEGSFSGFFRDEYEKPLCAVYPASVVSKYYWECEYELYINLPRTYFVSSTSSYFPDSAEIAMESANIPMFAEYQNSEFRFKMLCGALCFQILNVPANSCCFELTTDKDICGEYYVDFEDPNDIQTNGYDYNNSVAIGFPSEPNETTRVFYVPVPVGTYEGLQIKLYDKYGSETGHISSDKTWNVSRRKMLYFDNVVVEEDSVLVASDNRCLVVHSTDMEEYPWDNQFYIYANRSLSEGEQTKISFKYKADKEASIQTQCAFDPGNYLFWQAIGDVNFTQEWQVFELDFNIAPSQDRMQTIMFNLNCCESANNYYFKDITWTCNGRSLISNGNLVTNDSSSFLYKSYDDPEIKYVEIIDLP